LSRSEKLRRAAKAKQPDGERRSKLEMAALGLDGSSGAVAYVALKYYRSEHQCFSQWSTDELRAFSDFCRKVSSLTWQQIYQTSGKGANKTGLAYTSHDGKRLPAAYLPGDVSEDIGWFELRVGGKARAHGFRAGQAFFLVFLDRNHEIFD
jgi:hypothetical protein